jgi:hypothetical protein
MTNGNEAEKAIAELNGRELGARAINVNEARPKPEHSRRSGGRETGGSSRGRGPGELGRSVEVLSCLVSTHALFLFPYH